jgi:hypothetical protein
MRDERCYPVVALLLGHVERGEQAMPQRHQIGDGDCDRFPQPMRSISVSGPRSAWLQLPGGAPRCR